MSEGFELGLQESVDAIIEAGQAAVSCAQDPSGCRDNVWGFAVHAWNNPGDVGSDLIAGFTDPFVEDWQSGNQGRAIGRGLAYAVEAAIGTKGLTRLRHASKIDNAVPPAARRSVADDVLRAADDAFSHGYRYDPRIRARGLQDPVGHNFPYSYDDVILQSNPIRQADGSLLYRTPGSINSKGGFFEIAVNPDTGTIFHRVFVGGQ